MKQQTGHDLETAHDQADLNPAEEVFHWAEKSYRNATARGIAITQQRKSNVAWAKRRISKLASPNPASNRWCGPISAQN